MNRPSFFQIVRLAMMVLAIAGIIYALEFMQGGIAVWFWVMLLGVGFFGLLFSFRAARQRAALRRKLQDRTAKRRTSHK